MLTEYITIKQNAEGRFIIDKSVFLFICEHIKDAEAAEKRLSEIRKQYPDATHRCYAYIADGLGNIMRFSDDGEPQGTAGMPMLEVLKANNLRHTLACAVRWFGGKKLGAGGLTRAYARSAKEAVQAAGITTVKLCAVYALTVPFPAADKITRIIKSAAEIIKTEYTDTVKIEFAVPLSNETILLDKIKEALSGSIEYNRLKEEFI